LVPITPPLSLRPQEEAKPETSTGKTSTQSPRKPEVVNIINATSVLTPPPSPPTPPTAALTASPTTHFTRQVKGKQNSTRTTPPLSIVTVKSSENADKITQATKVKKPKTTHGSKTRKKLENQERVRKKKATLLKTQALHEDSENPDKGWKNPEQTLIEDKIETQIIQTRRRFQFEGGTKISSSGETKVPISMTEDNNKLSSVSDRVLTDMGSLLKLKKIYTETCPEVHFYIRLILGRGRPPEDWFRVFIPF